MEASLSIKSQKAALRKVLRARRRELNARNPLPDLVSVFRKDLNAHLADGTIAGFAPIGDEINIWPLLNRLHQIGRTVALPVVMGSQQPLQFRIWHPGGDMELDRYGVSYPSAGEAVTPSLVLVPLLGFTARGERLGYGGGYYDRTLDALRRMGEVFACGVAYAGQEVAEIPTDAHDAKLDGILTETGFKAFT